MEKMFKGNFQSKPPVKFFKQWNDKMSVNPKTVEIPTPKKLRKPIKKAVKKINKNGHWCVWMESNHRPPLYQSGVLPLNYTRVFLYNSVLLRPKSESDYGRATELCSRDYYFIISNLFNPSKLNLVISRDFVESWSRAVPAFFTRKFIE